MKLGIRLMKSMKKFFISNIAVLSVLASMVALTACSEKEEVGGEGTYRIEVQATKGATDGVVFTRALELSDDGMTLIAPWEAGEKVYVYGMNPTPQSPADAYKPLGTLTAQTSGVTTTLAGELSGTITVGDLLLFSYQHDLDFNFSPQDGSLDKIASDFDGATCVSSVTGVGTSTITLPTALGFSSQQCVVRFTLTDEEGAPIVPDKLVLDTTPGGASGQYPQFIQHFVPTAVEYSSAVKCGAIEVNNPSYNVIFVALSGNYDGTRIMGGMNNANLVMTATVGSDVYVYEKSGFSFENDKYYVYEVVMKKQSRNYSVSVEAVKGYQSDGSGTRALVETSGVDETSGKDWREITATWEIGEDVYVYLPNEEATSAADRYIEVGQLTVQTEAEAATSGQQEVLKTTLGGNIDGSKLPGGLVYLFFSYKHPLSSGFSYMGQDGTLEDIDDNHDFATCESQVYVDHGAGKITFNGYLTFQSEQSITRFALKDESGTNPINATKLVIDVTPMPYAFTNNQFQQYLGILQRYDVLADMLAWDNFREAATTPSYTIYDDTADYFFITDASRVGPIEITPAGATDAFYVALRSNWLDFNYGRGHVGSFEGCKMTLTATTNDGTYVFEKEDIVFNVNYFYNYEVWMKKEPTTSD